MFRAFWLICSHVVPTSRNLAGTMSTGGQSSGSGGSGGGGGGKGGPIPTHDTGPAILPASAGSPQIRSPQPRYDGIDTFNLPRPASPTQQPSTPAQKPATSTPSKTAATPARPAGTPAKPAAAPPAKKK